MTATPDNITSARSNASPAKVAADTDTVRSAVNTTLTAVLLAIAYTLAGATALSYEVLWVRMLSLQFGVSIFGVVITVTAFMAGLGAGSLIGVRLRRRVARPLLLFALLEAAIAGYALALPWMREFVDMYLASVESGGAVTSWYLVHGGAALLLLMIPATAMGIGFPLALKAADSVSLSLGKLYGFNTLGGAAGALLPLMLLPLFGWQQAVVLVASLGFVTALLAVCLAFVIVSDAESDAIHDRPPVLYLSSYAGIGAAALIIQVGWSRLFGMVFLRTEYVVAVILMTFLTGVGIGSLLVRQRIGPRLPVVLPLLASGAALLSLWLLPSFAAMIERAEFDSLLTALWWEGLAIGVLTLPVTLVLGAWLPVLSAYHGGRSGTGAWLYGANSLGAALGALLAGVLLIPLIGTTATIVCGALTLFVCGMAWSRSRLPWLALPVLLLAAFPVAEFPEVQRLLPGLHDGSRDISRYEDAVSVTHVIEQPDGQRLLLSDLQRMDASSDPTSVMLQQNQARLPLLLHPQPRRVLFLGLGTGISASGALAFPAVEITAVELSRGAIDAAARWFAPVNSDVVQRIGIVQDDARRYLRASQESFDVIVGDVFHPDLAGRGALLSVQQFRRARERLAAGGVFVQWLALNQFDVESLDIVLRSFQRVFPDAALFVDGFRLALVGSLEPIDAAQRATGIAAYADTVNSDPTRGEGIWTWFGRYWGRVGNSTGVVQDEWSPQIEFRLPRARYVNAIDLTRLLEWLVARRPSVTDAATALHVAAADGEAFERAYIATGLVAGSWLADLRQRSMDAQRQLRLAYRANPQDRWAAAALADKMYQSLAAALRAGKTRREALETVLHVFPEHSDTLRALWHLETDDGNLTAAAAYRQRLARISPLDSEIRAQ